VDKKNSAPRDADKSMRAGIAPRDADMWAFLALASSRDRSRLLTYVCTTPRSISAARSA
jgi:hypothetical protein